MCVDFTLSLYTTQRHQCTRLPPCFFIVEICTSSAVTDCDRQRETNHRKIEGGKQLGADTFLTTVERHFIFSYLVRCLRFTKLCWVEKHVKSCDSPNYVGLKNMYPDKKLLWNRRTPQPKANPTQEKKNRLKVAFGPLFPTANIFFRDLGLVLYRKQTTRSLAQPNSLQTP